MIENKEGSRQNLIKLNIDELEGPERLSPTEKSNENKDKSEVSQQEYSYTNNADIKLEEEENNNNDSHSHNNIMNTPVSQKKQNYKSSQKKGKNRRSRLTIDPDEDFCVQHTRKTYTEEEKIKKAIENSIYFTSNLISNRNDLNIQFLKRKIEQNYEREDKLQVFFNVPFFPKEDMFTPRQLAKNNAYIYNMNRNNNQYNMQNKMGMIPNRNINYQNGVRYINNMNNINNNVKPNSNINLGKNNNTNNIINNVNNNTNNNSNNNINNNINQINNNGNNQINKNNTNNSHNSSNNYKNSQPILDTSLLKDTNNNFTSSINKNEGNSTNKKNGLLFALKTNNPPNNNSKNNIILEKESPNDSKNINIENKEETKSKESEIKINHPNSQGPRKIDLGVKKITKEKLEKDKKENKNENSNKKLYNVTKE